MSIQRSAILCMLMAFLSTAAHSQQLKAIDPVIGFTPDISNDAAKNQQRLNRLYKHIDSIINTYESIEDARKHLTPRQIEIWENEEEYSKEDHLDISTWGCSWYCGGGPDSIYASSTLKPYKDLDYKAENVHDFSLRTAWVEGVKQYGTGESITFKFARYSPPVTTVEIFNGYMKSDKTWQENSRVKQLKLYVNGKPYALLNLKDIKSKQIFNIGSHQGQKNALILKFEIVDVYKGDKYDDVAISEIEFDGTGVHCFSKGILVSVPSGETAIEQLTPGDTVLSYNIHTRQMEPAVILELAQQKHHNLYELEFGEIKIQVTEDHPFYSEGSFYAVMANHTYDIKAQTLVPGQEITFFMDGSFKKIRLTGMKKIETCQETYTIVRLDRNKIFFANGALAATEEIPFPVAQHDAPDNQ